MSKRKVIIAILFIASISLINVAVLIEASYQGNQLDIDPFELQSFFAEETNLYKNKLCNFVTRRCDISNQSNNCLQYPRNCTDQ